MAASAWWTGRSATVTATVKSVDQATREVVLTDEQGAEVSFIAGENVQSLAQLKAGEAVAK